MPELPEVETIKNQLDSLVFRPAKIKQVSIYQNSLREKIVLNEVEGLKGELIHHFHRRAKYLLWETDRYMVVSHLGMTGSWRVTEDSGFRVEMLPHDHLVVQLFNGQQLIYNDPRRFGLFRVINKLNWQNESYFKHLGWEPLQNKELSGKKLFSHAQNRHMAIKTFLMDQKVVVGVGNIYACEVLFLAKIKPQRLAQMITLLEYNKIVKELKAVLRRALRAKGTTIRDFRQATGDPGHFFYQLRVYGREGKACLDCGSLIQRVILTGRSTYWCPKCQI